MPSISPLMMLPTTRPRVASGARCAAYGTRTCTDTEPTPISRADTRKGAACVDRAAPSSASTAMHRTHTTKRRFSTRSPKGTTSSKPAP